ncbi:hypothetical protein [Phormidium tenue]|jgi:hypothetical protein|uniref:Glutamine amidotransferase type-2 domain-containing protein n=1 Tax=Phormidium tenue FACHB-1050 TaxID=2692857 RepID=A0ABR8C7Y7_9CYAN|nr:hypothetical protein [Phormidium tenue]MBD2316372.1 hypothetical protein [Phormidium tenue FACHB-1050]
MNDEIIAIYCLCYDILKAMNHRGDEQQQMSDGEVMTTAIVAMLYYCGNFEKARKAMSEPKYIPKMLSRSRFNRRLHRTEAMLLTVFETLGQVWKQLNIASIYSIDSFLFVTISVSQSQSSMISMMYTEDIKSVRNDIFTVSRFI